MLEPFYRDDRATIYAGDALTVHRLLAWSPRRNAYLRGPGSPIDAGIVVLDEASMLDLHQLRALLRALRPEATLVLVGDADQLDSVGAGSVGGTTGGGTGALAGALEPFARASRSARRLRGGSGSVMGS